MRWREAVRRWSMPAAMLFGESAGARNVCFHVVSPQSRGLFHAAISQSGDCTAWHWPTLAEAEAEASTFVDSVGCGEASDVLACLRDKPAGELMVDAPLVDAVLDPAPGGSRYSGGHPAWDFGPIVDGDFVPMVPREAFASGEVARVPYLMGSNTEEGALAHLSAPPVSRYACAVQDFAERATTAGLDVYAYNFDMGYAIPGLESLGKAHGAELSYVFKSLAPDAWPPGAEAVADLMQGYWARFAATGDPNGDGAPDWPTFSPDRGNRLQLNSQPTVIENFRSERCAVWRDVFANAQ
ncbi:MAG: carboxylesterase family protein [Myxococcota bacterium]